MHRNVPRLGYNMLQDLTMHAIRSLFNLSLKCRSRLACEKM
jgi:hypothetical protein